MRLRVGDFEAEVEEVRLRLHGDADYAPPPEAVEMKWNFKIYEPPTAMQVGLVLARAPGPRLYLADILRLRERYFRTYLS